MVRILFLQTATTVRKIGAASATAGAAAEKSGAGRQKSQARVLIKKAADSCPWAAGQPAETSCPASGQQRTVRGKFRTFSLGDDQRLRVSFWIHPPNRVAIE